MGGSLCNAPFYDREIVLRMQDWGERYIRTYDGHPKFYLLTDPSHSRNLDGLRLILSLPSLIKFLIKSFFHLSPKA